MGRKPCCDKVGMKRGPWTIEEDHKLINFILNNGIHCWRMVPKLSGLLRCGKSCRLRWMNYLRPDLKRGAFSESEENQIIQLHARLGNRWSKIASHFPGRTDNEIKNRWNTQIKKRLRLVGIDPVTHKPTTKAKHKDEEKVETNSKRVGVETEHGRRNEAASRRETTTTTTTSTEVLEEECPMMLCGSLDVEMLWSEQENAASNSCTVGSLSFSMEDSVNPCSIGESSSGQWGVDSVDSMLSWGGFNHLEQEFFALLC